MLAEKTAELTKGTNKTIMVETENVAFGVTHVKPDSLFVVARKSHSKNKTLLTLSLTESDSQENTTSTEMLATFRPVNKMTFEQQKVSVHAIVYSNDELFQKKNVKVSYVLPKMAFTKVFVENSILFVGASLIYIPRVLISFPKFIFKFFKERC